MYRLARTFWGRISEWTKIPADGMIEVTATFDEAGTYVLWGRADDGWLYDDSYITVNVE